ncbi:MAG: hypothetical protein K9G62_00755 [Alphaproteobacteria bacterium]|nr:hypothetical protein [Alphaproteobacteria bacterium]
MPNWLRKKKEAEKKAKEEFNAFNGKVQNFSTKAIPWVLGTSMIVLGGVVFSRYSQGQFGVDDNLKDGYSKVRLLEKDSEGTTIRGVFTEISDRTPEFNECSGKTDRGVDFTEWRYRADKEMFYVFTKWSCVETNPCGKDNVHPAFYTGGHFVDSDAHPNEQTSMVRRALGIPEPDGDYEYDESAFDSLNVKDFKF